MCKNYFTLKRANMKKIIITCAMITSVSMIASAQDMKPSGPTPSAPQTTMAPRPPMSPANSEQMQQRMAEGQAKNMERQFALNAEQYKGVYQACLDFSKGMGEMRGPGKTPKPGDREKLEATRDAKFKQILTSEQYAKYETTRQRRMPPPGAPAPAAQPPVKN